MIAIESKKTKNNFLKYYIRKKDDFSKFFVKFIRLIQKTRIFEMFFKKKTK